MSGAVFVMLGVGTLIQVSVGRWVGSPWVVPDLILISMILAMAKVPEDPPMSPGLWGAVLAMVATLHEPVAVGLAYLGAAWLVRRLAFRLDLADPTIQLMIVGIGEAFLLGVWLMLDSRLRVGMVTLFVVRLGMTVGCVPMMRRLVARLA